MSETAIDRAIEARECAACINGEQLPNETCANCYNNCQTDLHKRSYFIEEGERIRIGERLLAQFMENEKKD
jgi:hypothetical protein